LKRRGEGNRKEKLLKKRLQTLEKNIYADILSISRDIDRIKEKFLRLIENLRLLDRAIDLKYNLSAEGDFAMSREKVKNTIIKALNDGRDVVIFAPPGFLKTALIKEVFASLEVEKKLFVNSSEKLTYNGEDIVFMDNAQDYFDKIYEFIETYPSYRNIVIATNYALPETILPALKNPIFVDKKDLCAESDLISVMEDVIYYAEEHCHWPALARIVNNLNKQDRYGLSGESIKLRDEFIKKNIIPVIERNLKKANLKLPHALLVFCLLNGFGFPFRGGGVKREWLDYIFEKLGWDISADDLLSELKNMALLDEVSPGSFTIQREIRLFYRDNNKRMHDIYNKIMDFFKADPVEVLIHDFMNNNEEVVKSLNRYIHPLALYFGPFNLHEYQRKLIRSFLGYQIDNSGRVAIPGFRTIEYILSVDDYQRINQRMLKSKTPEEKLLLAKLFYGVNDMERFKECFKGIKKGDLPDYLAPHHDFVKILFYIETGKIEKAFDKINHLIKDYEDITNAMLHLLRIELLLMLEKDQSEIEDGINRFFKYPLFKENLQADINVLLYMYKLTRKIKTETPPLFERYFLVFLDALNKGDVDSESIEVNTLLPEDMDLRFSEFYRDNYVGIVYPENWCIVFPDGRMVSLTPRELGLIMDYFEGNNIPHKEDNKKALYRLKKKLEKNGFDTVEFKKQRGHYKIINISPPIMMYEEGEE